MTLREQIFYAIVDWLGGSYDEEERYPGNPDYRNRQEVEELVNAIMALKS